MPESASRGTDPSAGTSTRRRFPVGPRGLWIALLLAAAADVLSTVYGLSNGFVERNAAVRAALAHGGYAVLVPLKLAAIGLAYAAWRRLPRPYAAVVPLTLTVVWWVTAALNAVLVLSFAA